MASFTGAVNQFCPSYRQKQKPRRLTGEAAKKAEVIFLMNILPHRTLIRNKGYVLPNPLNSLEDFLKTHGLDLEELEDVDLYREEVGAKMALANLDPHNQPVIFIAPAEFISAQDWLLMRIAAIRKERQRRREAFANGR